MALSQWLKAVFIAAFFVCGSAFAQSTGDFVIVPTPGATKINGAAGYSGSAQVDGYGDLSVLNAAPAGTPIPFIVNPSDTTATSTLDMTSIASNLTVSCSGKGSAAFWANRTTETGTLKFQYSDDGTNWNEFGYVPLNLGSATEAVTYIGTGAVATISAASLGATKEVIVPCTGHSSVRALVSSAGVGNLSVFFRANATVFPYLFGIIPGTGAVNLAKKQTGSFAQNDVGVAMLAEMNTNQGTNGMSNGLYGVPVMGSYGALQAISVYDASIAGGFTPTHLEDAASASGDAGVFGLIVKNTGLATLSNTDGDYQGTGSGTYGNIFDTLIYDSSVSSAVQAIRKEDSAFNDGDAVVMSGLITQDPLTIDQSTNNDVAVLEADRNGALWVRTGETGSYSTTTPSISTATSTTVLASNSSRKSFIIQNNSAANICCSLSSATLTGIVPTGSNVCMVLTAGSSFTSPPNFTDTAAITCYQTSGGTLNNVVVMES